jgi:hypothetical protein
MLLGKWSKKIRPPQLCSYGPWRMFAMPCIGKQALSGACCPRLV